MNVKVQLFSIPQKVFPEKYPSIFTLLLGYFTDQTGIHAAKAGERKQSVNKESFSFAYFNGKPSTWRLQAVRQKASGYKEENVVFCFVKRWITTKNSSYHFLGRSVSPLPGVHASSAQSTRVLRAEDRHTSQANTSVRSLLHS